jgi:hypothetical protein
MNDARSTATIAVLMRFTWTFLPTVTIDLADEKASDVPPVTERDGRFLEAFRDELRQGRRLRWTHRTRQMKRRSGRSSSRSLNDDVCPHLDVMPTSVIALARRHATILKSAYRQRV